MSDFSSVDWGWSASEEVRNLAKRVEALEREVERLRNEAGANTVCATAGVSAVSWEEPAVGMPGGAPAGGEDGRGGQ